ncbi:(Fe-S)-binding protein [Methanosarcina sp.]|uniref:(Fe-S)-binding protein n=1 Tax=Methanosarcina sp. TaxID=2213 RepID=UPI002988D1D9|nr:(Fe-S)-binding protein [Methanosarcina sp.]MDW5550455.1 (Fe-S)-binding protein [Methanosarcina sp.]MDW5554779.1 (Fe-S)-binding protein [Methanosarcina sp.]MDW5559922.1 (Fe-S)-binding protein [Methanosarcina sp.]
MVRSCEWYTARRSCQKKELQQVLKMSENPNETKLVNFAMANSIRRKIINFLADGYRSTGEIGEIVEKATLGFHLKILKDAGLIELEEETVKLSEYGTNFLKGKKEKNAEEITDFSQAKPIEIARVKQVLPCIADSSKLRVSANMTPPLSGVLKLLEPLFPRSNYSDRKDSLIIQKGEIITTVYGSGKVSIRMVENEDEAKEELERLKSIINEAIAKGVAPAPREKAKVDLIEIYKYLPQTNCGKCGEQGCYSFAIKLMARQVALERCTLLKEPEYASKQEHLQVLTSYI